LSEQTSQWFNSLSGYRMIRNRRTIWLILFPKKWKRSFSVVLDIIRRVLPTPTHWRPHMHTHIIYIYNIYTINCIRACCTILYNMFPFKLFPVPLQTIHRFTYILYINAYTLNICVGKVRVWNIFVVDFQARGVILYCVGPVNPITGKRNVTTEGIISCKLATRRGKWK